MTKPITAAAAMVLVDEGELRVDDSVERWLPSAHASTRRTVDVQHTGADVLGVLVARASGKTFDAFLRERIFDPLGMKDTGFSVPASQLHRLPPSVFADGKIYDEPRGQWSTPPAFPAGAGGLVSTIDDYSSEDESGSVGAYGWDGGMGTSWRNDPKENAIRILMTQRAWTSPSAPEECRAFWRSARA